MSKGYPDYMSPADFPSYGKTKTSTFNSDLSTGSSLEVTLLTGKAVCRNIRMKMYLDDMTFLFGCELQADVQTIDNYDGADYLTGMITQPTPYCFSTVSFWDKAEGGLVVITGDIFIEETLILYLSFNSQPSAQIQTIVIYNDLIV